MEMLILRWFLNLNPELNHVNTYCRVRVILIRGGKKTRKPHKYKKYIYFQGWLRGAKHSILFPVQNFIVTGWADIGVLGWRSENVSYLDCFRGQNEQHKNVMGKEQFGLIFFYKLWSVNRLTRDFHTHAPTHIVVEGCPLCLHRGKSTYRMRRKR